jgi:hypothetical protein
MWFSGTGPWIDPCKTDNRKSWDEKVELILG